MRPCSFLYVLSILSPYCVRIQGPIHTVAKVDATQARGLFSPLPPPPCRRLCSTLAALSSTVDVGLCPSLGVWVVLLTVSSPPPVGDLLHFPTGGCQELLVRGAPSWEAVLPQASSLFHEPPQVSTGPPKAVSS